ncbi:type IV secretion system protein VirB10 [Caulobacter segnis]|uniref:type IV secretion system protein VirB10 n=1 Tax=Caulobacter segnis TaxID=88688 RepID=UPI00240F337F|nr:type IV secretion system protein VirB10 [Caulobacter segnis]MDG2520508.1 type IV secretion system protein VirB10 [Caulobacter segnis]
MADPGAGEPPSSRAPAARPERPAPVLAWSASTGARAEHARSVAEEALIAVGADDEPDDDYRQLRQASSITRTKARRMGDRKLLLAAGAAVPCTLQTAMDSSLPGQVICLVGRDVWSDNGAVVLMEKGARVLGEYRRGLKAGDGRLFVLWTRVVTPGGVAVQLASPAADALGRAGFDGEIDRHFWRRFGGAVLLSVVDGAAVAAFDDGGGRDVTRLPSQAAGIAVDRSIDIAPTLRKPQGSQVTIMVAQDLDFSDVYGLQSVEGGGR